MNRKKHPLFLFLLLAPKAEFHQAIDYHIEARLDDSSHVLTGRAEMRYHNHAPTAIDTLYFHLHLNAFRPNSDWAKRDLQFNIRSFQDLGPDDYAYERVHSIRVNGVRIKPVYPFAPDSTVMAVPLKKPIGRNATAIVKMDWTARLSAKATRRQGRAGRHYDWAHWYPRIAVYDTAGWQYNTLVRQGEFFGEFANYDVTLDVAQDQIIGATGVPVSGDPGWQGANKTPDRPPVLKRDAYPRRAARPLGLLGKPSPGRKQVRWRAEKVIHFAWSTDPNYQYEGDTLGNVALHILTLAADTAWRGAMAETKRSLMFFDSVLGPYVYPQLTAVRRVEPGATEFPMLTTHAPAPAINHETGHQWAHAILANNEFRQGWLDEGLDSYLGFLYSESQGRKPNYERVVNTLARLDSLGKSQPLSLPAREFTDFGIYQAMTYAKPAIVLRMLHWYVGDDAMRKGLRLYYQKNRLTHVDEQDFKRAIEHASGRNLDEFFQQWFHQNTKLDFSVASVDSRPTLTGGWHTIVGITREGNVWMPVEVKIGDKLIRADNRDAQFKVEVETARKPDSVVLDPNFYLIDIARTNNTRNVQ